MEGGDWGGGGITLKGGLNGLVMKIDSQVFSSRPPFREARNYLLKRPIGVACAVRQSLFALFASPEQPRSFLDSH